MKDGGTRVAMIGATTGVAALTVGIVGVVAATVGVADGVMVAVGAAATSNFMDAPTGIMRPSRVTVWRVSV